MSAEAMTAGTTNLPVPSKAAPWALWQRYPKMFWSSAFLILIGILSLLGPILVTDPTAINPDIPTAPPWPFVGHAAGHWFGTDDLGRDLLSRLAVGARISLLIGLATALVSVVIGTL